MSRRTSLRIAVAFAFAGAVVAVSLLGRRADSSALHGHAAGFRLRDVAKQGGVRFVHRGPTLDPRLDHIAPHVAGIGAAVSVTDYDNDGWSDLYFTSSRFGTPNGLYRNNYDGTFTDVAGRAGVADLNRPGEGVSMGGVWGDYDNDGFEDLFVYRWGYQQLFRGRGDGTFEDVSEEAGLRRWMNTAGAIWVDYDRDGLLDLYVAGYFREDVDFWNLTTTRIMHNSFEFATNGGKNYLFRNRGDGTFEDVTDAMGVGSTRWTMAVASADFSGDGWPDLYLANDYGPEELYLNQQGRGFTLARAGLGDDSKSGMSVSLGDVHNRGRLDVFVTNISERGYLFQGNNLRLNFLEELGKFQEVAKGVVADAGWAWGAQFGDLNNDGFVDLFVTNGFISADRRKDYWYGMSKIAGAHGAIFEDAKSWPPIGTASLSGYERSRLLLNRDGELVDVAPAVGVTDTYDGRAVAFADLFNRGVLDAIVANQNGPALVYRNEPLHDHHWIQLDLVGTRSNRSAIGAEVTVELGGNLKQRQVVDGGMGFASQNQRRLHFGLAERTRVSRVVIRWPSGTEQILENVEADRLHVITEP